MNEPKKYEYSESEPQIVGEPVMDSIQPSILTHQMSEYVLEDIRIGLEQYKRGEYDCAWSFIESIRR